MSTVRSVLFVSESLKKSKVSYGNLCFLSFSDGTTSWVIVYCFSFWILKNLNLNQVMD